MGYRSDGKLIISKKVVDQAKVLGTLPTFFESMTKKVIPEDAVYLYQYDSYKMYASYPDVAEFYTFLDELDDQDDVPYQYIEVGEDGQASERGDYTFGDMYTETYIHTPYDTD